jgi:glycosyltransferase involved in cell wall biosynthesis
MPINKKRVAVIVTSVLMVKFFLVPHLKALAKEYDVTLILKNDEPDILRSMDLPLKIIVIPIERKINFFKDIYALILLVNLIWKHNFDLIHTLTPKAGLLGTIAAWINRVPVRIHTFQGEVWASKKGIWRLILRSLDKLVACLATHLLVVSESERQYLISEKIIPVNSSSVLGNGSIGGVDLSQFNIDPIKRASSRTAMHLTEDDVLFVYVGRLNLDKGVLDLGEAFRLLAKEMPNVHLLIVGPDEEDIVAKLSYVQEAVGNRLSFQPYTSNPEMLMQASDVLVLPSYREGFGVVVIEAAACGVPAIGSRIYGVVDAIESDITGKFFEKGDVLDLFHQMKTLASSKSLREAMGQQAYQRVKRDFVQQDLVNQLIAFYSKLI